MLDLKLWSPCGSPWDSVFEKRILQESAAASPLIRDPMAKGLAEATERERERERERETERSAVKRRETQQQNMLKQLKQHHMDT